MSKKKKVATETVEVSELARVTEVSETDLSPFKYELGDKVKDRISGYTGIIVGRTQWFSGCIRYIVVSVTLNKDGSPTEINLDEGQAELVEADAVVPSTTVPIGGPRDFEPSQRSTTR